jgi:hypothetical protein
LRGVFDLKEFVGMKPDAADLALIMQMYEDSRAGLPFDGEKYGAHFRAYTDRNARVHSPAPTATPITSWRPASRTG